MRSIKSKLVIMYIALVFIIMISSGTFMLFSIRYNEYENAEKELGNFVTLVYDNVIDDSDEEDFGELFASFIRGILPSGYEAYIIRSSDGRTIQATDSEGSMVDFASAAVISARNGKEAFSSDRSGTIEGRHVALMELAAPVTGQSGEEYVIYVVKDATSTNESLEQLTRTIALALVMALVFALVVGALFAQSLTGPISVLTRKTKDFAEGRLEGAIKVQSHDEIGQLTESFNNMASKLNSTLSDMEGEKSKLEIVLYNMTDGILVYDTNGGNIHANSACAGMLDMDLAEVSDTPFLRMLQRLGLDPEVDWEDGEARDATITVGDKYINLVFNPYKNKEGEMEGIIIVLQDITRHIRLDNMRREFVANVSHEIRTPITTIKSYTETIMDGVIDDKAKAMEFLNIINNEADRMTNIVRDLLELSRLDNQRTELNLEETDLVSLVRQNVKMHKQTVKTSKLNTNIIFKSNAGSIPVNIDAARVNQVLNNIISNSIRYSLDKARIEVEVERGGSFHRVYVRDNGMGIPKEDLTRIFERFYRVDKARSRALGGTGLGLSIAREIMEAHGGSISATSELNKGTTMTVMFPEGEADVYGGKEAYNERGRITRTTREVEES